MESFYLRGFTKMNRRDFIGGLAGILAASRISELKNLDRILTSLPASASLILPRGRSFMLQQIVFSNSSDRDVKPRVAIGKQLVWGDWVLPPNQGLSLNLESNRGGYQLEDDEPVILTGQPGTTVTFHGVQWEVPKPNERLTDRDFLYYAYFLRI